jgi:hypothetical protein
MTFDGLGKMGSQPQINAKKNSLIAKNNTDLDSHLCVIFYVICLLYQNISKESSTLHVTILTKP